MPINIISDDVTAKSLKSFLLFGLIGLIFLALLLPDTALAASFSGTAESGVSWDLSKYKDMMGGVYLSLIHI